jgi:hypothetical protein
MATDDDEDWPGNGPYVETYYDHGRWFSRRNDCAEPFQSGSYRERLIAAGAEVARWNHIRHVIRDTTGEIIEIDVYAASPYPPRSPVRHFSRSRSADQGHLGRH